MDRPKTKCLAWLIALLWLAGCAHLQAQNKYDVLARMLQPFGALFYSKSPVKALQADVVLREGPATVANFVNQPVRICFQIPDKLRIETLDPSHPAIFCRSGQRIWIYPRELAEQVAPEGGPRADPAARIPDFRIPFHDNQIPLLPALFQVTRFESTSDSNGKPAWALDFRPSPELLRQASEEWSITAIIDQHDFKLRRLQIQGRAWTGTFDILESRFVHDLSPETWEPAPEFAASTMEIPPALFGSALERISAITFAR
jgi:hypothetical protein